MPSFFPRPTSPRRLPLTPPEFVPSYQTGCGGMPYQQTSFSGLQCGRQHDESYEFADRYGQIAIAMPPMYPQSGTYLSTAPQNLPRPELRSFYAPAGQSTLPPLRVPYQTAADASYQQRSQTQHSTASQQPAKEEKPVGGVSAKLDYDMEVMTDFVCDMAQRLVLPGRLMPTTFRKWVHQMLCATRLPSATIVMSIYYLANRMSMPTIEDKPQNIFHMLTIALVLGSKFLDDNTFINRSWSEVSAIPVKELNELEKVWLVDIGFKLHRDPAEQHGWTTWSDHWQEFQSQASARANRPNKLSPIDTPTHRRSLNVNVNVNLNVNQNKPLPPLPTQQSFNLPSIAPPPYEYPSKSAHPSSMGAASFGQFDPWRAANGNSPESAPTTGPTTPEYYGAANPWASAEGYSRRTMFGYPPCGFQAHMQTTGFPAQAQPSYGPPAYSGYSTPSWSPNRGPHDYNCGCMTCGTQRSYMSYGLLPQPVAV